MSQSTTIDRTLADIYIELPEAPRETLWLNLSYVIELRGDEPLTAANIIEIDFDYARLVLDSKLLNVTLELDSKHTAAMLTDDLSLRSLRRRIIGQRKWTDGAPVQIGGMPALIAKIEKQILADYAASDEPKTLSEALRPAFAGKEQCA